MTDSYFSLGDDYGVKIPMPDGGTETQTFGLTLRDDPPKEIVLETIHHFCYALTALANGIDCKDEYVEPRTELGTTPQYNRVVISFADVKVAVQGSDGAVKHVPKKVCMFSEHTTAYDFMEAVKAFVQLDNALSELGVTRSQRRSDASNGNSGGNVQRAQNTAQPGKTPYFEQLPGRQELGEQYNKRVVSAKVLQVDVGFDKGQRTYKLIGSYNGDVSQFPITTVYAYGTNRKGEAFTAIRDEKTLAWLEALGMGNHDVDTRAVFFVNKSDATKTNTQTGEEYNPVYLNLNKLDIAHEQAPKAGEESQVRPDVDNDVPNFNPDEYESRHDKKQPDDIPF